MTTRLVYYFIQLLDNVAFKMNKILEKLQYLKFYKFVQCNWQMVIKYFKVYGVLMVDNLMILMIYQQKQK
jgi:hypothetical protein